MTLARIEDVRLPSLLETSTEGEKRLSIALYDQFRDGNERFMAIENTLGMTPRREKAGFVTSPLTTKGDIWTYSTLNIRLAVGTNGQYLRANSAAATGLAWTTIPFTDLTGSVAALQMPALTGDVTTSAGAVATAIGATKVTSAMLNSDVYSTAHSWGGTQTFTAPVLGTPASGTLTNAIGLPVEAGLVTSATNDSAAAGKLGQLTDSAIAQGSAVALTSGVAANLTSISLTAGDWDVWCDFTFLTAGTTTVTSVFGSISNTTGVVSTTPGDFHQDNLGGITPGNTYTNAKVGPTRKSLAGTTTVYGVASSVFGTSTMSVFGLLRARRVR